MTTNEDIFGLDAQTAAALAGGMDMEGGAIRLPFAAPAWGWQNGKAISATVEKKDISPIYFGIWRARSENIDEVVEERGPLPGSFAPAELEIQGELTDCYTSRLLVIAPITYRRRWEAEINGRQEYFYSYPEGIKSNRHIQMVALLGLKQTDGTYTNWGPIMLSVYGYQVDYLLNATRDWKGMIEKALKKHSPGARVPASAFFMAVGSVGIQTEKGPRPLTREVGKSGATKVITPIELYKPPEITAETLRRVYVGNNIAYQMKDYLDGAQDWVSAWTASGAPAAQPAAVAGQEYDDHIPEEPGQEEPF